jgi:hypothetical protein
MTRDDGSTLTLPRIRGGDVMKVRHVCRIQRGATFVETLILAGIRGDAQVPYLMDLAGKRLTENDLIAWANNDEAQREILLLCLQRQTPRAGMEAVDALDLSESEMMRATAAVMGWAVSAPEAPAAETTEQQASEVQQ